MQSRSKLLCRILQAASRTSPLVLGCFIYAVGGICVPDAMSQERAQDTGSRSDRTAVAVEALKRLKGIDLESNPALKSAVLKVLESTKGTPQFVELVRE